MSKWCITCYRTPYIGCDKNCPIFGTDYKDLSKKYFELLNSKTETERSDEELLPENCLYIEGFLSTNYDGIFVVCADPTSKGSSIIESIEDYAYTNGFIKKTDKGLGEKHSIIENCNMRAYFTKRKSSLNEAQMSVINMLYDGDIKTKTSYTGYSEWTITGLDLDEFSIGGHDLTREFLSHIGEYIHLIIEC